MTDLEVLHGIPQCFRTLYWQVRLLSYDEAPDYASIKKSLRELRAKADMGELDLTDSWRDVPEAIVNSFNMATNNALFMSKTPESNDHLAPNQPQQAKVKMRNSETLLPPCAAPVLPRPSRSLSRDLAASRKKKRKSSLCE